MTTNKLLLAAAAASAIAFAVPAQAQVAGGIATVDQMRAVVNTKAFGAAFNQINTSFKPQIDQATARRQAAEQEAAPSVAVIDTNHDQKLSQDEIAAARAAKNPALAKLDSIQQAAERDIAQLQQPILLAQAYATELLLQQYEGAQGRVITARKIGVVLTPDAFIYAPDSADITSAVTSELDKAIPSVPVTPPANWQPQEGTVAFLQRFFQIAQMQARAGGGQGAPAAAAPAAAPRTGPAKPAPAPQSR